MTHNLGISMEWTTEEQMILEDGLAKYVSESSLTRYAKIAVRLQSKTVRDVALRCRWMTNKENIKRRKEDLTAQKRNRDRKERVFNISAKQTIFTTQPNISAYTPSMISMENNNINPFKGKLLEQNAQLFSQISSNLSSFQIHENIGLFCQAQNNLLKILGQLDEMPMITKQMPPLPVIVNEELAKAILPHQNLHR